MSNEALAENAEPTTTLDIMANLDEVQRERFVMFQETFETSGWQLFREWARGKVLEAENNGVNAKSWEDNRVAFGVRAAWIEVYNMAERTMAEFEQVALSNQEEISIEEAQDDLESL